MANGDYYVICDYSGFKCLASDTRMTWDGYRVRKDFWEARNPQDIVRARRDSQAVPNPRPWQPDVFKNFIDIQEFGVTGDGSGADLIRIQNAINTCARGNKILDISLNILTSGQLFVPPASNLYLRGKGNYSIRKTFKTQGDNALLRDQQFGLPANSVTLEKLTFGNPDEAVEEGKGKVLNFFGDNVTYKNVTVDKWNEGFASKLRGDNAVIENYTTTNPGSSLGTDGFHIQGGSGVMRGVNVINSTDDCIGVFGNDKNIIGWEFNNVTGTSANGKLFGVGLESASDTAIVRNIAFNNVSGGATNVEDGILIENQSTSGGVVNDITINNTNIASTTATVTVQIKNVPNVTFNDCALSGGVTNIFKINNTLASGNNIVFNRGSILGGGATGCTGRVVEFDGSQQNGGVQFNGTQIQCGQDDGMAFDNSGGNTNSLVNDCAIYDIPTNHEGISLSNPSTGAVNNTTFTKATGATNTAGIRDNTTSGFTFSGNDYTGVDNSVI